MEKLTLESFKKLLDDMDKREPKPYITFISYKQNEAVKKVIEEEFKTIIINHGNNKKKKR